MLTLISTIAGLVGSFFTNLQQVQAAKQATILAIENNKARLASDTLTYNAAWEMAELANADKWMRRVSFVMFTAPFIIAIIAPHVVSNYFTVGLAAIPAWYVQTYVAITGAVWGISSLKNTLSQVASSFVKKTQEDDDSDEDVDEVKK